MKHSRNDLLTAIQNCAESWKNGKETLGSHPAKTALCIALDEYEFEYINEVNSLKTNLRN